MEWTFCLCRASWGQSDPRVVGIKRGYYRGPMYLGKDLGLRPEKCRPIDFSHMFLHSERGIHDAIRRVACKLLQGLGPWALS